MAAARVCSVCRAILTVNDAEKSPGFCPYCKAETESGPDFSNPYEAPRTGAWVEETEETTGVPVSIEGKTRFALKLFFKNLVPIALLDLTVWIPLHLLLNYLIFNTPDLDERRLALLRQLAVLMGLVFAPISMGGILQILYERMNGRSSSYRQSLEFGLRNWGRLFTARFFASLWILLGFLALIVPAILFTIRFCLIEPVVLFEEMGPRESRERSTELVKKNAMGICLGYFLFLSLIVAIEVALKTMIDSVPSLRSMWVETGVDCIGSVLGNMMTCYLFVYFWEGHVLKPAGPADQYKDNPFAGLIDRF